MSGQVLCIEPQNEIKFKVDCTGTFEQGGTTYMKLTNPTSDTVLFKIKTTAPKKYCVRPNSGVLEPNSKVEIAITPQPVYVDPNEKHKHKFMVQSIIAPEGKTNVEQVWKEISPDLIMDYKLKCVFEVPRGATLNDAGDSAVAAAARSDAAKKRTVAAEEAKPSTKDPVMKAPGDSTVRNVVDGVTTNTPFNKYESAENDLQKAKIEVSLLREEESKLRHENLEIKEELLRLRQMVEGRVQRPHSYGPEKQGTQAVVPMFATALAMAIIGIIIGKFFM